MYVMKAFASHTLFVDNTIDAVNALGELSTESLTFARDKGSYNSTKEPAIELTTFRSDAGTGPVVVPQPILDVTFQVVGWLYTNTISTKAPVVPDQIVASLTSLFGTSITNIAAGAAIDNKQYWITEWVSFTVLGQPENVIKIWFGDQSFQNQYDEFDILPVPPLLGTVPIPLDSFFNGSAAVDKILSAMTVQQQIEAPNDTAGQYPYTVVRSNNYQYNDPLNPSLRLDVQWSVVLYGRAGDNIDSIRTELQKWILKNSTRSRDEWVKLFPDIFRANEFVIVPLWNQYALPDIRVQAGIYSPIVDIASLPATMAKNVPFYTPGHISSFTQLMSFPFRSLQLSTIGSLENKQGKVRIRDYFPDYIDVPSTSPDFNRMTAETKTFAERLMVLTVAAESFTESTPLPPTVTKVRRDGLVYLATSLNGLSVLVLTKNSFVS